MAFVRRRTTRAGRPSTALVESYRDEQGRPRQRVLANLYGEPDTLSALGKLAAQRHNLKKERTALAEEIGAADKFYETITSNVLQGHKYSAGERREIDRLMRARKRLHKHVAKIELDFKRIEKAGGVIKKHCPATAKEIRTAAKKYQDELKKAEAMAAGLEYMISESKADLRRLRV